MEVIADTANPELWVGTKDLNWERKSEKISKDCGL